MLSPTKGVISICFLSGTRYHSVLRLLFGLYLEVHFSLGTHCSRAGDDGELSGAFSRKLFCEPLGSVELRHLKGAGDAGRSGAVSRNSEAEGHGHQRCIGQAAGHRLWKTCRERWEKADGCHG